MVSEGTLIMRWDPQNLSSTVIERVPLILSTFLSIWSSQEKSWRLLEIRRIHLWKFDLSISNPKISLASISSSENAFGFINIQGYSSDLIHYISLGTINASTFRLHKIPRDNPRPPPPVWGGDHFLLSFIVFVFILIFHLFSSLLFSFHLFYFFLGGSKLMEGNKIIDLDGYSDVCRRYYFHLAEFTDPLHATIDSPLDTKSHHISLSDVLKWWNRLRSSTSSTTILSQRPSREKSSICALKRVISFARETVSVLLSDTTLEFP